MKTYMTFNNVEYEVVRADSAKGQSIIAMCDRFDGYELYDVYTHWSLSKDNIFEHWKNIYKNMEDAHGFRICSHNSHIFTLGWYVNIQFKTACIYITPTHNYIVI